VEALIESEEDAVERVPEPVAPVPVQEAYRWLFWRRARADLPEPASPTAALEERPSRAHVRRLEPEPAAASAPVAVVEPEPETGPAVTARPLDLPGLEEPSEPAERAPARPRFGALRARAAERSAPPPPSPPPVPPAQEWNLWDLERRAREQGGTGPQAEEWSALFTHLRVFANADGVLPKEFDGLVRESFPTLIEAA
jgi:hypothetical protein